MNNRPGTRENRGNDERLKALGTQLNNAREAGSVGRGRKRTAKLKRARAEGLAWRIAAEMIAAFAFCGFFGWWIDEWSGTRPLVFLVGMVLGGIIGIYNVFRITRNFNSSGSGTEKEEDGSGGRS